MVQIVIQHLMAMWTKQSRGGDGARKRNAAMPRALKIPSTAGAAQFLLHSVVYSEHQDFAPASTHKSANDVADLALKLLEFFLQDSQLRVRFFRDGYNAATPSPYPFKEVFTLQPQQWGRLTYNGRYTDWDTGEWWYEHHVYNIGFFDGWKEDVFLKTAPVSEFSELAHLR